VAVEQAPTATAASVQDASPSFGQRDVLTVGVTADSPSTATPDGSVAFYDTTTQTDLGSVPLSAAGTAQFNLPILAVGTHTIAVSYDGTANFRGSDTSVTLTVQPAVYVLSSSAGGALKLSGNATLDTSGLVQVDSSSKSALVASGNAQLSADDIVLGGGDQLSGHAQLSEAAQTGVPSLADPLAGLAAPDASGLTNYGAVKLGGNSTLTLHPGIYTQITVSGNAT
jgi:hypothetical protein